jgi:hypothetical protein
VNPKQQSIRSDVPFPELCTHPSTVYPSISSMLDGNSTYGYQRVIFDIHATQVQIVKWFTQFRGGPASTVRVESKPSRVDAVRGAVSTRRIVKTAK